MQGGDLGTFRTYILQSKGQRFTCNNQKSRNQEHHFGRAAELGFYLIATQKGQNIMSSLYMREMALYDLAFKCLECSEKYISEWSTLRFCILYPYSIQLFVMHLLRFLVLVWEERKANT